MCSKQLAHTKVKKFFDDANDVPVFASCDSGSFVKWGALKMTFQPSCLTSLQQYGYHQSLSLFLSSMSVVSFPSLLLSSSLFHSIFQLSAQPDGYVFHGSTSPSPSITYTQTHTHRNLYIHREKEDKIQSRLLPLFDAPQKKEKYPTDDQQSYKNSSFSSQKLWNFVVLPRPTGQHTVFLLQGEQNLKWEIFCRWKTNFLSLSLIV